MKLYFIFTKKGLAVILTALIAALIIIGQFSTVSHGIIDGSTNQKRVDYLTSLGLRVNETALSVKNTRIPEKLSGIYYEYNEIQKSQGFNLLNFKGKSAIHYSYALTDMENLTVNILVVDNRIIAGDITDNLNGNITALVKEK